MTKKLNNYRLYTIGYDAERTPVVLTFLIYAVKSAKNARRIVLNDKHHLRVLHRYHLTKKTVSFTTFKCDRTGVTQPAEVERERKLIAAFPGRQSSWSFTVE